MREERDVWPVAVPLAEAAERLGLSTEAVRKRIQRGTLPGRKVDGAWWVGAHALPPWPAPAGHLDRSSDGRTAGQPPPLVLVGGRSALPDLLGPDAGRTPGRPATEPGAAGAAPLAARLEEPARENGRLGAERDSDRDLADRLVDLLQGERDGARARVAELEVAVGALAVAAAGRPAPPPFWSRPRGRRR